MHLVKNNQPKPPLYVVKEDSVSYNSMSDSELVLACQRQEKGAFDVLAKRHQRTIRAQLYKISPDWMNSHDDMTQEVLLRMWRSIGSLKNPLALNQWIRQITTNFFYDELRKRPKMVIQSMDEPIKHSDGEDTATRDIPDNKAQPDEIMHRLQIVQQVNEAIDMLPQQFKNVIVLRELHGLPYEEIAVITNTEIGTVKSRIARARQKMQTKLEPLRYA